jgi:hypothetical protein
MNKDAAWFGMSILIAALAFWVLALDSNTAANITAGCALFAAGWTACYRSGKYLNMIKS